MLFVLVYTVKYDVVYIRGMCRDICREFVVYFPNRVGWRNSKKEVDYLNEVNPSYFFSPMKFIFIFKLYLLYMRGLLCMFFLGWDI